MEKSKKRTIPIVVSKVAEKRAGTKYVCIFDGDICQIGTEGEVLSFNETSEWINFKILFYAKIY